MLHGHADFVLAQGATEKFVRRYTQMHIIGLTQKDPERSKIDAVSIFAFPSMNDVEAWLVSEDHAAIQRSEDHHRPLVMTVRSGRGSIKR
ncbi:hypothetical protein NYF14_14540 [Sphingobium sp. 10 DY56-G10]|uniref:hypothetical protein n=1 Tax=Sphingobium sp. 10 DY56-G10 TaxID=2974918 RepID=UPI0000D7B722|nr:hypothetical protein SKA58_01215 [Sphingomonas sp. SKA58]